MKKFLIQLALLLAAWTARAAEPPLFFNAVLTVGNEHRFVLVSPTGKTSSFLRAGQMFEGHTIGAYDAKEGTLTVEHDGKTQVLSLVSGAAAGEVSVASPATLTDAQTVLTAMNFADMMDKTMSGVRRQQSSAVEQMTKKMVPPGTDPQVRDEIAVFQGKLMEEMTSGITGEALKDDVAKVYADVFTKEELQALSGFYQTPLGKIVADKQPELSEKMNGVVMSKMMMSPKAQQMMQDFSIRMKAKKPAGLPSASAHD